MGLRRMETVYCFSLLTDQKNRGFYRLRFSPQVVPLSYHQQMVNMGKDSTKNLVGQPIFKQMIKLIPRDKFNELVLKCRSDCYYKTFFSWEQLVTMLYGIFSRCDSMGEVCDGMRALGGKLNYLGMDSAPAKSTAGDGLRDRSEELFRLFYFALVAHFSPFLSVSRKKKHRKDGVSFEEFYAFDSSTITLFSDIMKGVGRNPKGVSRTGI